MTADNALNTYLGIYDIDATNMSHAEKIGKIYGIAFNNGIEHALCRVTEQDYIVMTDLRTGEDVEYVRFKLVLDIIDDLKRESNITIDSYTDKAIASKDLIAAVQALKGGE